MTSRIEKFKCSTTYLLTRNAAGELVESTIPVEEITIASLEELVLDYGMSPSDAAEVVGEPSDSIKVWNAHLALVHRLGVPSPVIQ